MGGKYRNKIKQKATFKRYRLKHKDRLNIRTAEYLKTPKGRYSVLVSLAKSRNLPLDISEQEHGELLKKPCHYCGGPLNSRGYGLDKIKPEFGYLKSNVVPCCKRCNQAKNDLTVSEFKEWVASVHKHFLEV